ncbi:SPOR domain-containing protein [Halomonas denitrificans]|uniref:SPOR domain-containing protein n=1 Tax=Halomonas TaxID=2745 RepID=UPI001C93D0D7|nr:MULTISPECIES: SPOR domain-containing protein [Halomonas]MBY5927842.1 SPOR domain-containing protein [Halomonas sp. DP8Y7-3]MBY6028887.1 SPOR domain-containing protein [Halomonas sp. DP8Y7-1]MCA0976006.1 SPOR domain-containing protein [Halomonas denitrificans]
MATRKAPPRKRGATSSQKRKQPSTRGRGGIPGWLWAAVGLAAGFLLAHHQNGTAPWQDPRSPIAAVLPKPSSNDGQGGGTSSTSTSGGQGQSSDSEPPMPTFEFYTLLPESEVIASDEEVPESTARRPEAATSSDDSISDDDPIAAVIAANSREDTSASTPSETPRSAERRYMLQAASFREVGDARQLAGRLKDFGLLAKISEVEATGGATWHRVQVGPYSDRNELARAQDLMSTQGIEPLLIQLQN